MLAPVQPIRLVAAHASLRLAQTLIKERFIQVNGTLENMHQTQRTWTVSDTGLKAALRERICANFLPVYNVRLPMSRGQDLHWCCMCLACAPQIAA